MAENDHEETRSSGTGVGAAWPGTAACLTWRYPRSTPAGRQPSTRRSSAGIYGSTTPMIPDLMMRPDTSSAAG